MIAGIEKDIASDNSTITYPEQPSYNLGGTEGNYFKTNYTYYEFNMTKGNEVQERMSKI
jgi:hypothetical protein